MSKTLKCVLTNMALIEKDNMILVQNRLKKDWPGITFPGGHVEKDEDLISSIKREIKEETGLSILDPKLAAIEEYKTEDEDKYLMLLYKVTKFEGELKNSEEGEVYWINKDELKNLDLSLDLLEIYESIENPDIQEFVYFKKDGKWDKKFIR